jgi:hypothetical protein
MNSFTTKITKFAAVTAAVIFSLIAAAGTTALAQEAEGISFDNLKLVDHSAVSTAYIDPKADFSVFQRVMILDPFVSFVSNWQRDQNRSRSRNIRASDMERIKTDTANLFRDVFTEQLEAAGYEIVHQADYDVLLLRPAIIDLNITAPDTRSAGRSRTFTATAGAATMYIELFDSVSGTIIGRAADRKAARSSASMSWSSRVTNRAEASRMFRGWADTLIAFLDKHYTKK